MNDDQFVMEYLIDETDQVVAVMFSEGLKPIPRITVSEWSDTYRMLSSVSSAEPGKFRTVRVPYIRKIADSLGKTSDIWKVIVMKGAQLGLTELGNNWIGYLIHMNPGPVIMVMPTDAAVKKNSKTRIKPMIESTPALRDKIKTAGSKEAGNTVNEKEFPGGVLIMIGANSPVGLSSTPAGKIFLDEVDRYPHSAGDEGSPIDLATERANTFSDKKLFIISTPTNEGESVIAAEFLEGNQQYYNVPCIHCSELFVITFDCLTWQEGKPETTKCACPNCGGLHEERHKTAMFAEEGYGGRAKWIATAVPLDPLIESYHISGLYSPAGWLSWVQVVRKFLRIKGDVNKERTFINTTLAQTFKIKGEVPDFKNLYTRRESYEIGTVPDPVCLMTMGVDVQPDRLEMELVGWCPGRTTYSVEYKVLVGDTSKDDVWKDLKEVINETYKCDDGSYMGISLTCVDAGYNTKKVTDFCATFENRKVLPIMGRDSVKDVMVLPPKAINITKAGKKIKGSNMWYLGTSLLKSELYGYLKLTAIEIDGVEGYPDGYCHFPQYDQHYFEMLTAEEHRMTKNKKTGKVAYEWVKVRNRNEALDCRNYARAASYILGIDRFKTETWEIWKTKSKSYTQAIAPAPARVIKKKSGYWDKNK